MGDGGVPAYVTDYCGKALPTPVEHTKSVLQQEGELFCLVTYSPAGLGLCKARDDIRYNRHSMSNFSYGLR